jgi:hypothetical protein
MSKMSLSIEDVDKSIRIVKASIEELQKTNSPRVAYLERQLLFLDNVKEQIKRGEGLDKIINILENAEIDKKTIKIRKEESCKDTKPIYSSSNEKIQTQIIRDLGNATIGQIYFQLLSMYEKVLKEIKSSAAPPGILAGMIDRTNHIFIQNGGSSPEDAIDKKTADLEDSWYKIAKSLGVIYGSFMKLLDDTIGSPEEAEEKSKKIQSFAFDTAYDVVSSATTGSASALTHAIGQIPPFGIMFSLMHMIQTAIDVGTKSIGSGMIALDPIMEIFGQVIGSKGDGTENYHDLLKNLREILIQAKLVSNDSSPYSYIEKECKKDGEDSDEVTDEKSGSGSGSGSGSDSGSGSGSGSGFRL